MFIPQDVIGGTSLYDNQVYRVFYEHGDPQVNWRTGRPERTVDYVDYGVAADNAEHAWYVNVRLSAYGMRCVSQSRTLLGFAGSGQDNRERAFTRMLELLGGRS